MRARTALPPKPRWCRAGTGIFTARLRYGGIGYDGYIGGDGYASSGNGVVFRLAIPSMVQLPQIITQPTNQTVLVGGKACFSVSASGGAPLHYFWRRNGAPIAGATSTSYCTNNLQLADSGSGFSCLVSNVFGTALSSTGMLAVAPLPTDYFTELFGAALANLAFQTYTFTPDGGANYYEVCRQAAAGFPTDSTGGTTLNLSDDGYAQIVLSGGSTVAIYTTRTNVFYVGSNGYLTMNSGDTSYSPSYASHFALPRVSALYQDLDPAPAGWFLGSNCPTGWRSLIWPCRYLVPAPRPTVSRLSCSSTGGFGSLI